MNNHRNLMVLAINKLLDEHLISLESTGKIVPDKHNAEHLLTTLAGYPAVIIWQEIGHDELRVSVWWKYNHQAHPQKDDENFTAPRPLAKKRHYSKLVGVTVSGWVERRKGPHLQGYGRDYLTDIYTRREELDALAALPRAVPHGYRSEGKFFR